MAEQTSVRVNDTLAERVKVRMEALGLNPFSLAKRAALGESYVRDLFRGKGKDPGAAKLAALANALGCDTTDLLDKPTGNVLAPLALRIQTRLKAVGLTPRAASVKAGLGPDAIRSIFNGSSQSPRGETLSALAAILGCSVDYLLGEDGERAALPAPDTDAITLTQSDSGMWFATRENERPLFVAAKTLEELCAILPEAVRRAG